MFLTDRRAKTAKGAARVLSLLFLIGVCAAFLAPAASATLIGVGELGEPDQDCDVVPFGNSIFIQTNYVVPVDGTIIKWRFESGAETLDPEAKLKVLRQEGSKYKVIGETLLGSVGEKIVTTVPADIPVMTGDILGLYSGSFGGGDCLVSEAGAPSQPMIQGDLLVGEAEEPSGTESGKRAPIGAIILPPPVLTRLEPPAVFFDHEDDVTIIGENFEEAQSVTVGGNAVPFTAVSDTELKFVTPLLPVGEYPVSVTTPAGITAVTKESTLVFGALPGDGSRGGGGLIDLGPPAPAVAAQTNPPAPTCKVPKLKGRKLKDAKQAIRGAGCTMGKVTAAKGVGAAKAKVASQQPAPGKQVASGTKVAIKLG
jgi:hypothetical protein